MTTDRARESSYGPAVENPMTDEVAREVRGKIVARLKRKPELLLTGEHAGELADHLVPTVLAYLADELALAAEMFEDCAEAPEEVGANPEQTWSDGVRFAAGHLLKRAAAVRPQRPRGGSR